MNLSPLEAEAEHLQHLAARHRWGVETRGTLPGRGAGRRLGSAGEFEGYRRYEPGDDLRLLDPRVFARLRRPMVKVLREDSIVPVTLLIDTSASMAGSKREASYAALALFIFYLTRRGGDPLRIYTFTERELTPLPTVRDAAELWRRLEGVSLGGTSRFGASFRQLPPDRAGRGIVIVFSDAMGVTDPDSELSPLARVGLPFLWVALERNERHPPDDGNLVLRSREREPEWRGALSAATRNEYARQLERYHHALRRHLLGWGGDLFLLEAEQPPARIVEGIVRRGTLLR